MKISEIIAFLISVAAPWAVTFLLAATAIIITSLIPKLLAAFRKVPTPAKIVLIASVIAGALIRFMWVPDGHRIYFDEDRYLTYAVNFARHGKAVSIIISTPEKTILGDPDPAARVTVPTINAWALKLLGYDERNLFLVARIFSVIQIVLIFIAAYLIFESPFIASFSAVGIAILPTPVYWSVSANIDSYFVFFSLLTLLAAAWYAKRATFRSTALLSTSLLLLLFVRFESFLFLPSLVATIYSVRKVNKMPIFMKSDILLLALTAPLVILRAVISLPVFGQVWCCAEATPLEVFTTSYIFRNTIPNVFAFFNRPEFPFMITVLALICLFSTRLVIPRKNIKIWIFVLWIILFFSIYSFYYAGQFFSYTFSGSYGRFFLMLIPPLIILSGMTLEAAVQYFKKAPFENRNWLLIGGAVLIITLIPVISNYRKMVSVSPWDVLVEVGPREIHKYIDEVMIPKTPPDAAIIVALSSPVHLKGKTAILFESFLQNDQTINFVRDYLKSGKPVFMFETNTCDLYPMKCAKINTFFRFVPDKELDRSGFETKKVELKESK